MTSDLEKRVWQHKEKFVNGFSKKYNCHKLLYYENTTDLSEALKKESQIKRYKREWKENLITDFNPAWKDLSVDFLV